MRKLDLIILCGGLGKRIRSKSKNLPKILININNQQIRPRQRNHSRETIVEIVGNPRLTLAKAH